MARRVSVSTFQELQRGGDDEASSTAAEPPMTVAEQLQRLVIGGRRPYDTRSVDEIVQRLTARAQMLGIPATPEQIRVEANRRAGQFEQLDPAPTAEDAIAAAEGLPLYADAPDEVIQSLGQDDPAGDGPVEPKGEDRAEPDYPTVSDLTCRKCGGAIIVLDEGQDAALSASLENGSIADVICLACPGGETVSWRQPKPDDQADDYVPSVPGSIVTVTEYDAGDLDGLHRALGLPGEPSDDAPMADRLADLDVGDRCTAEMSRSMIVGRVKDAVFEAKLDPTDEEIQAEADLIWLSFDANRAGPAEREYDVNPDGTLADWRRPDTTPDRGPDVGTTVRHVGEADQRFSGGGADDAQQQSLFLVPNDSDFKGAEYRHAPELANLAEILIDEHGYFEHLVHCEIGYLWKRKTGTGKRTRVTGILERCSGTKGFFAKSDFLIILAADTARERQFSELEVKRALYRRLRRIGQDDKGNFIQVPFSIQIDPEEITLFAGVADEDLKVNRNASRAAEQMGLFNSSDPEDDQSDVDAPRDDGAGTLIHADGTPMTADEIAEQERREYDDDPADPDAEYDEDLDDAEASDHQPGDEGFGTELDPDDDPLADHDL